MVYMFLCSKQNLKQSAKTPVLYRKKKKKKKKKQGDCVDITWTMHLNPI